MKLDLSKRLKWIKNPLRLIKKIFIQFLYFGKGRFCPVCGKSSRRFKSYGTIPRDDAQCIHCHALERHRLLWLFIKNKTNLFDGEQKKMLHVAPELCLEKRFKENLGDNYLTADLFNPRAMVKMDITNIQYSDQSFDVIYCNHVLEHVLDDRRAIREFYRVLKNNGWAILLVPITCEKTFEDPSIVDPKKRLEIFGHESHVRRYGPDYIERLRDAGFTVNVFKAIDIESEKEIEKMGLNSYSAHIYFCTK